MNYSEILQALEQASSFELYRLEVAIQNQLISPERIRNIHSQLHLGQDVEIFNADTNKTELVRINKFNPTRLAVTYHSDGSRWTIPYYWVNLGGADVDIQSSAKKGIDRNALSIGDTVGFRSKDGHEIYGEIIRINPKTVTLKTAKGQWRVAYNLLFPVIDGSVLEMHRIENQ